MEDGFPKRTAAQQRGEVGVNVVSSIVNDELKFLFRRNSQEHDFGVDGYIDFVTESGSVTGQCVAVQIKTGKSFFKTGTQSGYAYYGQKKHLNYYANLPMPVILIICDEQTSDCFWIRFSPVKTEPTETGWKINIPRRNKFCREAKGELWNVVGPTEDHLDAIQKHWAVTNVLRESDFLLYAVDRADVEKLDVGPVDEFFDRIRSNSTLVNQFQGRVELSISGYDSDPRELWEIPEVTAWFRKADPVVSEWFYFANTTGRAAGLKLYFACMANAKRSSVKGAGGQIFIEFDQSLYVAALKTNFLRLNELAETLGLPEEEIKRISFAAMDVLEIPHE